MCTAGRHRTGALALLEGQLELAYQPIVAVAGGNTAQYQLLLRLRQADGTVLAAGQLFRPPKRQAVSPTSTSR